VAGTTETEGREEAARLRRDRLVVQREEIEEQIERLDTVIALIRRDLREADVVDDTDCAAEPDDEPPAPEESREPEEDEKLAPPKRANKTKVEEPEPSDANTEESPGVSTEPGDEFDF